jgi:hypothetical protein
MPDLGACKEPFNGIENCDSYPNKIAYKIGTDENGGSLLTGSTDSFTISELEVYSIRYIL